MSDPLENPDFDLDEDLFDFAEVSPVSDGEADGTDDDLAEVLASFRAEAELDEPVRAVAERPGGAAQPPVAEEVRDEPFEEPAVVPAAQAPARRTAPARQAPAMAAAPAPRHVAAAEAPAVVAAPARFSRGLVAIALSMTVLNSVLAVVLVQRLPGSQEEVRADSASPTVHESPREPAPRHVAAEEPALPDPDLAGRAHGHPTLDQAREELARGDYAACRQHVYSLLSVVDRFDAPRREELEAECQYLIAQALHLEALARLGRNE